MYVVPPVAPARPGPRHPHCTAERRQGKAEPVHPAPPHRHGTSLPPPIIFGGTDRCTSHGKSVSVHRAGQVANPRAALQRVPVDV